MWFLQALFAGSIPEIIDIVKTFPKYNGTYVSDRGRRHVHIFYDLGMPLLDPFIVDIGKPNFIWGARPWLTLCPIVDITIQTI